MFKSTRHTFTAFAITPDILVTTRHGLERPKFESVQWENDCEDIEEARDWWRDGGIWEYHACFWKREDTDEVDLQGSGIMEYRPLRVYYRNSDVAFLIAQNPDYEHHTLRLGVGDVGDQVYIADVYKYPIMLWQTQLDYFKSQLLDHGHTFFYGISGLSGSPLLTIDGRVVGMFYGNKRLRSSGYQAGLFLGSQFIVDFFSSAFGKWGLDDLKGREEFTGNEGVLRCLALEPTDGKTVFPCRATDEDTEESVIDLIGNKTSASEYDQLANWK